MVEKIKDQEFGLKARGQIHFTSSLRPYMLEVWQIIERESLPKLVSSQGCILSIARALKERICTVKSLVIEDGIFKARIKFFDEKKHFYMQVKTYCNKACIRVRANNKIYLILIE